jgi:hypothetical protein
MTDPVLERLFDVVEECRISPAEFFRIGFAFFATAIRTLPPAEQEAQLRTIIKGDSLRQAVEQFPTYVAPTPMH